MQITLELVRDKWKACYDKDRLARLYDRPMSSLEVLTRKDGEWADVPDKDRLWTVLHEGCMTDRELRLVACFAADYTLKNERDPDPRILKVVDVVRRFADGQATREELDVARAVAWGATHTVAWSVAWSAGCATAWAAVYVAADAKAWSLFSQYVATLLEQSQN